MKLSISEPCYFKKHFTIDTEIIDMCNLIQEYFNNRSYSEMIDVMDVLPVVAPKGILDTGLWKEELMYSKSIKRISVFKHINYDKYISSTVEEKKLLTVKCIVEAIKMIQKKRGIKFDSKQFVKDLLSFTGYSEEEVKKMIFSIFKKRKNTIHETNNTEPFSFHINGEGFKNRIVSKFLIEEVIDYVEESYKHGIYEFFVLTNNMTKTYIQCSLHNSSFEVQLPISVGNGKFKLIEKKMINKKEVEYLFYDFFEGKTIDIKDFVDVEAMSGNDIFTL